ncbi:MAG: SIR2 family protein [Fibromonadaceae bacterium]|nr:SIR2 family protein [Fibromonadaceae bacterium]
MAAKETIGERKVQMAHDPVEYIRGLQQLLISDKKKVAFLFGAGTSLAKKNENTITVPNIGKMTKEIEDILCQNSLYTNAIEEIKQELREKFTVETFLSNIEQKSQIIENGTLNGLKKVQFVELAEEIKKLIKERVSIHEKISMDNSVHADFAEWIGRADKKQAIEIFTTNYDYLFELGLEYKNIPYYDGFTGSYQPFFDANSVENMDFLSNQTKLWKIHGSLGWYFDKQCKKIIRRDINSADLLIYPSTLKYDESKKQPYMALGDRLTNFLKLPDTILITCGYSFGDEHINERILTALKSNSLTHVFALYYNKSLTEESSICKIAKSESKISVYSQRHAVIGSQFGFWKLKREPSKNDLIPIGSYFDEDGPNDPNSEIGKESKGTESWTGEGELKIPDFGHFVAFLQQMMFPANVELRHIVEGQDK